MGTTIPLDTNPFLKTMIILYSVIILIFIGINNYYLGNIGERSEDVNVESDFMGEGGLWNWARNFISTYYPVFLGLLLLLLSNTFKDGGYANLFFLVILLSYLSSYSFSQSLLYSNAELGKDKKDDNCSFTLPSSDMFETKELTFFRFIYFLTIIIIGICISGINEGYYSYFGPYIFLIPFIFPLLTEIISKIVNGFHNGFTDNLISGEETKTNIRPEQLLIQFMRGKHTGVITDEDSNPEFKDRN